MQREDAKSQEYAEQEHPEISVWHEGVLYRVKRHPASGDVSIEEIAKRPPARP